MKEEETGRIQSMGLQRLGQEGMTGRMKLHILL